jgi:hypothetical protein
MNNKKVIIRNQRRRNPMKNQTVAITKLSISTEVIVKTTASMRITLAIRTIIKNIGIAI